MDMESLADHQYRYDQMLKERAFMRDDLFKPKKKRRDLEVVMDIRSSKNGSSLTP
jgi:hypothetical protein